MKVAILGVGGWGTALGLVLHANGHQLTFWGRDPARLAEIQATAVNDLYLPGVPLPQSWRYDANIDSAVAGAGLVVIAVPSRVFRDVASRLGDWRGPLVSVTKGIEADTGLTMGAVARLCAPAASVAALSGPSLAAEVARELPTAIVAACEDESTTALVQELFHRPTFRVYTSPDLLGVELGGALKNVIAIAAGVGDGLGFGDNTKAALVTRAIVEIRRLGVALGAKAETFSGLSGLGDLMVTCFSKLSRNRTFGERFGRGESAEKILAEMRTVVEGHPTARSAHQLALRSGLDTPIVSEVYAMLYEGKNIAQAVRDLTGRESKSETGS